MWALGLFLISLIVGGVAFEASDLSVPVLENGTLVQTGAVRLAHQFEVYREAVDNFASGHPGFSGTVPPDSLALPPGMTVPPDFSNDLEGGTAFAWAFPGTDFISPEEILGPLTEISEGSVLVGRNSGGILVSPVLGPESSIPLPGEIPSGSLVSVFLTAPGAAP